MKNFMIARGVNARIHVHACRISVNKCAVIVISITKFTKMVYHKNVPGIGKEQAGKN